MEGAAAQETPGAQLAGRASHPENRRGSNPRQTEEEVHEEEQPSSRVSGMAARFGGASPPPPHQPQPKSSGTKPNYVVQAQRSASKPVAKAAPSHESGDNMDDHVELEGAAPSGDTTARSGKNESKREAAVVRSSPGFASARMSLGKTATPAKSFVPTVSSSSHVSPVQRKWGAPRSSHKDDHHSTKSELVVEDPPPSPPASRSSGWVSPRTARLQALAAKASEHPPLEEEEEEISVVLPKRLEPEHEEEEEEEEPASNAAELTARSTIERPDKMSVADMKTKLWGGGASEKLIVPARPRTPPRVGAVAATTAPKSPPQSRISKGLIDVATPKGLAPPQRSGGRRDTGSTRPSSNKTPVDADKAAVEEKAEQTTSAAAAANKAPVVPRSGRSFKANIGNVLSPNQDTTLPWLKRREEEEEEKKSAEPTTEPESPKESVVSNEEEKESYGENNHIRSPSLGDLQVEEAPAIPGPPLPTLSTGERPLARRPSSDASDFPLPAPSPSRRNSPDAKKTPLIPNTTQSPISPNTAKQQQEQRQASKFAETIDCPPSDEVDEVVEEEEENDEPETVVMATEPRSPPLSPRPRSARPWTKDANTLSPETWQKRKDDSYLNSSQEPLLKESISSENVSPSRLSNGYGTPSPTRTPTRDPPESPGSCSLSQMAADSVHAVDFEQAAKELPPTTLSLEDDGSGSLLSNAASVPAVVPPEFQNAISDVEEEGTVEESQASSAHGIVFGEPKSFGAAGDEEVSSPPVPVAVRAKAIAKWNGGLGHPYHGENQDGEKREDTEDLAVIGDMEGLNAMSPIRRQASDDGDGGGVIEGMSPRVNSRGILLDDWHRNKSFGSHQSYEQGSDFAMEPLDDTAVEETEAQSVAVTEVSEVPTQASSVKPLEKSRKDSEPSKKQKDRRRRVNKEVEESPAVAHPAAEKGNQLPQDSKAQSLQLNKSTTFEFDPFGDDSPEKVEFTENTEFTEGSDFFGSANVFVDPTVFFPNDFAPKPVEEFMKHSSSREAEAGFGFSSSNLADPSGSGSLAIAGSKASSDFWSYDADTSTVHDDDIRHAEI